MAEKIVLPPKYYLTHFFEFIDFVQRQYVSILEPSHLSFLSQFRTLSENAQCCYIRMVNRKGLLFDRKCFLKYAEISDIDASLAELQSKEFIQNVFKDHVPELIQFLTKPKLHKWVSHHDIKAAKDLSRQELIELAIGHREFLNHETLTGHDQIVVQGRSEDMQYLLFLYFGRIQKSLTLYTLRDLGIRQSQTLKSEFKPRFSSKNEAIADYFFNKHLDSSLDDFSMPALAEIVNEATTYQNLLGSTTQLKNQLLFNIAEYAIDQDQNLAIKAFQESQHAEARQKLARHYHKMNRPNECLEILEQIQNDPRSDQELLFAEDFSPRKFNKKKIGNLTEVLQNSRQVLLSEFYLKKPELGVCKLYQSQGYQATFTENTLWSSLFGILFWDELFDSETAAIHNPFERTPSDLLGPDFYLRNMIKIEDCLNAFTEAGIIEDRIQEVFAKDYGRLNDIFQWYPELLQTLTDFIKNTKSQNVAHVLRTIAKNYETHHVGFPDLMVEKDGRVHFIEVKAEGDSLRASQLSRLRLLKEAGFQVEVLRVKWQTDPNQTYVVIDVETTGGSAPFHRVTEVGAVKVQNGKIIDEFQTLINPGRSIPPFITSLTGISNAMVADAPKFSEVAEPLLKFLEDSIFVAHNVKFDYSFIQHEFRKSGIEFVRPNICTCAGIKKSHPGLKSYSLKNLTQHFEIDLTEHHRALSDARAAAHLLIVMNETKSELNISANQEQTI